MPVLITLTVYTDWFTPVYGILDEKGTLWFVAHPVTKYSVVTFQAWSFSPPVLRFGPAQGITHNNTPCHKENRTLPHCKDQLVDGV